MATIKAVIQKNQDVLEDYFHQKISINLLCNPKRLKNNPYAMTEFITCCWLSKELS